MDPGQNDMGGHGSDDMGLVPDAGGAGVGRPAVGFDRRARGDVGGDGAMQRGGGEVLDRGQAKASGRVVFDFDGAGDGRACPGHPCGSVHRAPASKGDYIVNTSVNDIIPKENTWISFPFPWKSYLFDLDNLPPGLEKLHFGQIAQMRCV